MSAPRSAGIGTVALLVAWLVGLTAGCAGAGARTLKPGKAEPPPTIGLSVDFEPLRARLMESKGATVSPACGSVMWPWAYRGKLGADHTLRAYQKVSVPAPWVREFVTMFFHEADWDSVLKFRGVSKRCDQRHDVPLFAVNFDAEGGEVYALISLETRCAQIFESERPLGTLWFKDRADSVLGLIRSAFPGDSAVASLALPDEPSHASGESITVGVVDVLPEPVGKVPPRYPDDAIAAGKSGTVWVQTLVGSDGAVRDAFVRKSSPPLDDAALDAVWQWKFKPAQSGGKPLAVWVMVPIKFTLK